MTSVNILWIYIVLLLVGGFMGFIKAGSKISLITSGISAALLALCALGILGMNVAVAIVALLVIVFIMRLAKTKKFMPSGMMIVMSAVTLVLLHLLRK